MILPKLLVTIVITAGVASLDRLLNIPFPPPAERTTIFDQHPERGWTNRPNSLAELGGVPVRIDDQGLRVDEVDPQPAPSDARRILFLGDSLTLGYYVSAQSAFCRQAVTLLNTRRPGRQYHGLNGGTCGYDTAQQRHWLEHEGFSLRPEIVVLQICLNDVSAQYDPACKAVNARHPELSQAGPPRSYGGLHRALRAWTMRLRYGGREQVAAAANEHFSLSRLFESPQPEIVQHAWQAVAGEFRTIADRCKEKGIPLVAICFPIREQLLDLDLPPLPQEALSDIARQASVPFLDLLPIYRAAAGDLPRRGHDLFADDTHPTQLGHRLAAETLAEFLDNMELERQ